MATAPRMKMEEQPTKRSGETTKRSGETTKRIAEFYNLGGNGRFPETTGPYSNWGANGDYTVTVPDREPITIEGAIAIRVLNHGELNLLTDTGRWYLFAPGTWKTAEPTQPKPKPGD